MKINIHENTLIIKEEDGTIISTRESQTYIIYPSEGKKLRDKLTGYITDSYIGVSDKSDIANYEEF